MFVQWRIVRYARDLVNPNTWSEAGEEIDNFFDVMLRMTLGDGKDSFSFKIVNNANRYDNYWRAGDKVNIYYAVNRTPTNDDLLMNGVVNDVPSNMNGTQNIIEIKGNNYTETLTNALVFISVPPAGMTIPEVIQGALNSVEVHNPNFKVEWSPDNLEVTSSGSSFPLIYESWYYKTMTLLLERYSQSRYTLDGDYYWFIDKNNNLVWKRQTDNIDSTFNSETSTYKELKITRDTKDIVNFVIAKGGTDPKGGAISTRYHDAVSSAKNGFKYAVIVSETNTGRALMDLDQYKHGKQSNFPDYPFTTVWSKQDGTGHVTVSSDAEYTTAIRDEIKYRLKDEAARYVNERRYGKLQVSVTMNNGVGWGLGNVISVTIPKIGKTSDPMRVQDIQYTQDTEIYDLIEDVGTI